MANLVRQLILGKPNQPAKAVKLGLEILKYSNYLSDQEKAATYNIIGANYELISEPDSALFYLQLSLLVALKGPQIDSAFVADAYRNIGYNYSFRKNYIQALYYTQLAEKIESSVYKQPHLKKAMTYYNLAGIYLFLGKNKEGLKYHMLAYKMRKSLSPRSIELVSSAEGIGVAF